MWCACAVIKRHFYSSFKRTMQNTVETLPRPLLFAALNAKERLTFLFLHVVNIIYLIVFSNKPEASFKSNHQSNPFAFADESDRASSECLEMKKTHAT